MRLAMCTDIHFGARSNSEEHLQDCLDYIDWFITQAVDQRATAIAFLGDWMENRSAINVRTLKYSQEAARRLNALGLPVYFIVGNHDLYHRSNREIFSTDMFSDLKNFVLVNEPKVFGDVLAMPFLFREEYVEHAELINSHKYVIGHFEFRNFVVSGSDRRLDHGPDADLFTGPKYILSGHFHKRQLNKNIIYIGNTFPTNFGDAGDTERGMAVLDTDTEDLFFLNYDNAPLFEKTRLSQVLAGDISFKPRTRVRCLVDVEVGYSDVQSLREELVASFNLREFSVEEDLSSRKSALEHGADTDDLDLSSLADTVRVLIHEGVVATPTIDPALLVSLYEDLK